MPHPSHADAALSRGYEAIAGRASGFPILGCLGVGKAQELGNVSRANAGLSCEVGNGLIDALCDGVHGAIFTNCLNALFKHGVAMASNMVFNVGYEHCRY